MLGTLIFTLLLATPAALAVWCGAYYIASFFGLWLLIEGLMAIAFALPLPSWLKALSGIAGFFMAFLSFVPLVCGIFWADRPEAVLCGFLSLIWALLMYFVNDLSNHFH